MEQRKDRNFVRECGDALGASPKSALFIPRGVLHSLIISSSSVVMNAVFRQQKHHDETNPSVPRGDTLPSMTMAQSSSSRRAEHQGLGLQWWESLKRTYRQWRVLNPAQDDTEVVGTLRDSVLEPQVCFNCGLKQCYWHQCQRWCPTDSATRQVLQ